MRKFEGKVRLIFREGEKQIQKEDSEYYSKYSHLNDDGTIDLSLDSPIESKILDMFLSQTHLILNGKDYVVEKKFFSELEPAIYIQVQEIGTGN